MLNSIKWNCLHHSKIRMLKIDYSFYDRIENTLDIGNRMGRTYYIDFLTRKEVKKNLMKGKDYLGRKFIVIKIGGICLDTMEFFESGQVFFERYQNEPHMVAANFEGMFLWTVGGTTPLQYQLINNLVDGKLVKIQEEHRINSGNHNLIVANMDYWENCYARIIQKNLRIWSEKNRSAKIIQRNWKMCRYNPKYTICKKILNEQFDAYLKGIC